jgi:hypothetical protein
MRYRKLDVNGDYSFGHSLNDFYIDNINAVSQSVLTRLQLYQGSWFLDTTAGVPWNTQVLGRSSARTRDIVIKSVILGTNGVTGITTYSSSLQNRQLSITATITTVYSTTSTPISVSLNV